MTNALAKSEVFLVRRGIKNPRPIIYVTVAVLSIVAIIIIRRQVRKFFGHMTEKVDKHPVEGKPTITKDDAKSLADRMWAILNENFIVSFNAIEQIFDGYNLNQADKTMIYNAFGIRNNGFPTYVKGDMYFWLDRKVKIGIAKAKSFFNI